MKKSICLFFISSFLFCCNKKIESQQENEIRKQLAVTQIPVDDGDTISIHELMRRKGLKSLSVAVFEDYNIIWTGEWGVKFDSVPINQKTAYSTASISKPITATLCAILEDKGLIDLKAPVSHYLKRWQLPKNKFIEEVDVTLEHLLGHTAGTSQGGFTDFYEGDTIPTIVESLQGKIPDNDSITFSFIPGTDWKYSGGGYTIAMMALEDHFGKSLADLAKEHLFDPLNLRRTTMKQPNEEGFLKNVARAHNDQGDIIRTGIPITPQVSASGLWSTPSEMALILIEIQKALNGIDSDVISESVATRLTNLTILQGMMSWGLGWERFNWFGNLDWFSHGGANTGTGGYVYATMKDGNGMVFLGNGPNSIRIPIIDKLRDNIIQTHNWGAKMPWVNKEELSDTLLITILGNYKDIKFGPVLELKEEDGKLYFPMAWRGVRHDLVYEGNNTFIINDIPGKFRFVLDEPIKIEYYREGANILPTVMFEKVDGQR